MTSYYWYISVAYTVGLGGLFGYLYFASKQKKLQLMQSQDK